MTWTMKTRGTSSAPIVADYRCAEHGLFELLVERPTPDEQPCPECATPAPWSPSSPRIKHPAFISTYRGKSDPKPFAEAMDTEPLADGKVTLQEWKKQRAEMWARSDYDEFKAKI
jgi:hypothetical protein